MKNWTDKVFDSEQSLPRRPPSSGDDKSKHICSGGWQTVRVLKQFVVYWFLYYFLMEKANKKTSGAKLIFGFDAWGLFMTKINFTFLTNKIKFSN